MHRNGLHSRCWTPFVVLLLGISSFVGAAEALGFVLTGNPDEDEVGLELGCTYDASPPFSNPVDPEHGGRFLRSSVYAVYHTFETLGCSWFGPMAKTRIAADGINSDREDMV